MGGSQEELWRIGRELQVSTKQVSSSRESGTVRGGER